ncbi:MAG: SAM-dependent methyltransferase [Acetobacteraceae bacterium]|nr:SAM-dependent methyltransferase [Acetobacteraceae bacterium]
MPAPIVASSRAPAGPPGHRALSPANLEADFGRLSPAFRQCAGALYHLLGQGPSGPGAQALERWRAAVGEAAGLAAGPAAGPRGGREAGVRGEPGPLDSLARGLGLDPPADPVPLLFCVHTYFALLAKLLAWLALERFAPSGRAGPAGLSRLSDSELQRALRGMEDGSRFRALGVDNLLEGDGLGWYAEEGGRGSRPVVDAVRAVAARLEGYCWFEGVEAPPGPPPEAGGDLLKGLYHRLVPRGLRRSLGEYYTPDWLARHLLNRLEGGAFRGDPERRLIDPACGSGTFLVLAIRAVRRRCLELGFSGAEALELICRNVVGVDRNPLAVLAARANYLMALGSLLRHRRGSLELPVSLGDTVLDRRLGGRWGQFDYVAGNPPWVNWERLPETYRRASRPLWAGQGLFSARGMDAILGGGKKDVSSLMTYQAMQTLLKPGGRLGFVIARSVLKTAGAGEGFRRFRLGDGTPLGPVLVDDVGGLRAFEGASDRAAVVILQKGRPAAYPVPYVRWLRRRGLGPGPHASLTEALAATRRLRMLAEPVDPEDPASPWLTAPPAVLPALRKVVGPSDYRAHAGVYSGGANGVYWVEKIADLGGGLALVRNIAVGLRRPVDRVTCEIETDLLYPLLRGRDVRRWSAAPSAFVVMVQDPRARRGMDQRVVERKYPRGYEYLQRFEAALRARRSQAVRRLMESGPFYSMFGVGEYSFAPHKVVWHQMASSLAAAAVSPWEGRPVMPEHVHAFVAANSREEALYLAAVVNSTPFAAAAASCLPVGGKGFAAPHMLRRLRVPRYRPEDPRHRDLVLLSSEAHRARASGDPAALRAAERALDGAAAPLWGIEEAELRRLEAYLARLGTGRGRRGG